VALRCGARRSVALLLTTADSRRLEGPRPMDDSLHARESERGCTLESRQDTQLRWQLGPRAVGPSTAIFGGGPRPRGASLETNACLVATVQTAHGRPGIRPSSCPNSSRGERRLTGTARATYTRLPEYVQKGRPIE
jgi:hypothetical protein